MLSEVPLTLKLFHVLNGVMQALKEVSVRTAATASAVFFRGRCRPVLKILVLEDMIVTSTDPYEFDVDWGYNIFE